MDIHSIYIDHVQIYIPVALINSTRFLGGKNQLTGNSGYHKHKKTLIYAETKSPELDLWKSKQTPGLSTVS